MCYHFGTINSCGKYTGSGTRWKHHLRKHGPNSDTLIIESSDSKDDITQTGLELSEQWDIVNSPEFANLVPEGAESNSQPMQCPEVRAKAAASMKEFWKTPSQKMIDAIVERTTRRNRGDYTEAELEAHRACSKRQTGKTMKERLNNPNWTSPRKGVTPSFPPWNKGKTMKDLKGDDYIDSRSKPFYIISHLGTVLYKNESEFLNTTRFSQPTLTKLKRVGEYKVRRQRNTKHPFNHGEVIKIKFK